MGQYQATAGMPTASFQNETLYQKGLGRYSGYHESEQKYRAAIAGDGERSKVGNASAMTEGYEGAIREDEGLKFEVIQKID
jgi:hypothetical protein